MKIQAYKCRFTGAVYQLDAKADYIKHLKDLRASMKSARKLARTKRAFNQWLTAEKEKIVHIDMVVPWILENQQKLMKFYNDIMPISWNGKWHLKSDEITKLTLKAHYRPHVPNSHACPHDGVTNWGNYDKSKPTGYPGFTGRIEGVTKRDNRHNSEYPSSALLKMIGIHTGTGSGINNNWGYSVELFLADWPGLSQEIMFNVLKGTK